MFKNRELWRFINTFAPWFSALGTFTAVVVSLYLARRGDRLRLRLRCGIRIRIPMGAAPGPKSRFVNLEVINVGRRPARIANLYWKTGVLRRKTYVWLAPYGDRVGITLADGEEANYWGELREFDRNFDDVARADVNTWLRSFSLRVAVTTSTGQHFTSRVEGELRRHFLERARVTQGEREE
jgi:hypothetical protein